LEGTHLANVGAVRKLRIAAGAAQSFSMQGLNGLKQNRLVSSMAEQPPQGCFP